MGRILKNKLLVFQVEAETTTASGLIIPNSNSKKKSMGTVWKAGENEDGVKDGDEILFRDGAGVPVHLEGEELLWMNVADIVYVF